MSLAVPRATRRPALAAVWVAGPLLASGLPMESAAVLAPGPSVPLTGAATTTVLLALWRAAAGRTWAAARGALAVFAAMSVSGWVPAAATAFPPVAHRLDTAPVAVAFLLVNGVKVISVALVALVARSRAWGAADLLLRTGDPRAPAGPAVRGRTVRWTVAGPVVIVVVLALFLTAIPGEAAGRVVTWLPVIAAGALVNSAAEEFVYRHAAIRASREVMGTTPAMLLTSLVFGLAHVTGNPGGLTGVLYTGLFGLVCAHAMLRVRGFAWNLPIHFFGDVGVCATLVALAR